MSRCESERTGLPPMLRTLACFLVFFVLVAGCASPVPDGKAFVSNPQPPAFLNISSNSGGWRTIDFMTNGSPVSIDLRANIPRGPGPVAGLLLVVDASGAIVV